MRVPKNLTERELERKLVQAVRAADGICPKFTGPGFDGMPDRIVLLPEGGIGFVEVKWHGEKLRPLQESRRILLRQLGFQVFVLDNIHQINYILEEIQNG